MKKSLSFLIAFLTLGVLLMACSPNQQTTPVRRSYVDQFTPEQQVEASNLYQHQQKLAMNFLSNALSPRLHEYFTNGYQLMFGGKPLSREEQNYFALRNWENQADSIFEGIIGTGQPSSSIAFKTGLWRSGSGFSMELYPLEKYGNTTYGILPEVTALLQRGTTTTSVVQIRNQNAPPGPPHRTVLAEVTELTIPYSRLPEFAAIMFSLPENLTVEEFPSSGTLSLLGMEDGHEVAFTVSTKGLAYKRILF